MTEQNIRNLQKFLKLLNTEPIVKFRTEHQDFRFNTDRTSVKKIYQGLTFAFLTIWKIYLIVSNPNLSRDDQIQYLMMLPDPDGNRFITPQHARHLSNLTHQLRQFFQTDFNQYPALLSQQGGSSSPPKQRSKTDLILGLMFTPLKILEERFGPIIAIPLEMVTGFLTVLGMFSQILSSTFGMLPPIPFAATVFEALAELTEIVHVISNFFNMFLNIVRGNWYIVIQAIIGMFPQILELINGLTMQLIVVNRFVRMGNQMAGVAYGPAQRVIKMLTPILLKPLEYFKDSSNPYR